MSSGGGPPPKSLDAYGLTIPCGGGSTSILAGCRPFKVSFMASKERNTRASPAMVVAMLVVLAVPATMLLFLDSLES